MEKKILATAVSLAMGLEFFCGSTVLADASRFYQLPSTVVQQDERMPYDDSLLGGNDGNDEGGSEAAFNPYVFEVDDNGKVSASVTVNSELTGIMYADAFGDSTPSNTTGNSTGFNSTSSNSTYVSPEIQPVDGPKYLENDTIPIVGVNSTGESVTFNASDFRVVVSDDYYKYSGAPITPYVEVYNLTNDKMIFDWDYDITCTNNVNAGQAFFTVSGKGQYSGTFNGSFMINPATLDSNNGTILLIEQEEMEYSGDDLIPDTAVLRFDIPLVEGQDYNLTFQNNKNVGFATVIARGIGNYEGSVNATFEIIEANAGRSNTVISGLNETYEYTGDPITPAFNITYQSGDLNRTLESGKDYSADFINNVEIGNAFIQFEFTGNYTGNMTGSFEIVPASLDHDTTLNLSDIGRIYSGGSPCMPELNVTHNGKTLNGTTDYDVAYFNNTDAGTAWVEVTGKGNYNGTASQSFTIHPMSMYNTTVELGYNTTSYDGTNKTPSVNVTFGGDTTLQEGTDYEVSYLNNTDAGQAMINITGTGNFNGSVIRNFLIEPAPLSFNDTSISVYAPVDKFQGTPLTANISVYNQGRKLINGTDYDVTYLNNTEAGVALVTVTGKGNYNGTANSSFTIDPQSISSSIVNVNLSDTSFTFNGSEVRPVVTVTINGITLEEGKHYSLNYTANDAPGTGRVIVRGIGSLTGSVTKEFEIIQLNEYTITFDGNGGGGSMDPITVTEGDPFTVPECGFDAPVGKTFDDWDIAPAGSNMTVTENMTFTAQWKEIIYPVITGNDTWTEGDANLTVEFDAPIGKFLYAECAGENLTEGVDFILTEGSTVITLTEDFLKSLTAGTYTLTAHFTDGKGEWTFEVKAAKDKGGGDKESDSPQTSQPMSSAVFAGATVMAVAALGGMAYIAWDEIKKRYNR